MKKLTLLLLGFCWLHAAAQNDSLKAIAAIEAFQRTLNEEYKDPKSSPLDEVDLKNFEGHEFFPIDLSFRVNVKLKRTEGTPYFNMKTTTSRLSTERIFGYVIFNLSGKQFELPVYQGKDLQQNPEYADYLFFPFSDETNGNETYGGGRYIDLRIPKGDSLIVDFNMAYNPYCAYSHRYSCPLVPAENQMDIEVRAGIKHQDKKKHEDGDSVIYTLVEVMPEYEGGYDALAKFISKNLRYPKDIVKKNIEGITYVQFVVGHDGSITEVKAIRGISASCDAEAERVVRMMPKWKPGMQDGKTVLVRFVLPINFKGRKH